MKISEIADKSSFTYKLLFDRIYFLVLLIAIFFYVVSYPISLLGFDFQNGLFQLICSKKFVEFQKSELELTSFMRTFIVVSNCLLFVGPLLFYKVLLKQNLTRPDLTTEKKSQIYKVLFALFGLFLLLWLCVFFTPYSENLWGYFFYKNNYVYVFFTAFLFAFIFFIQFCIYCYLRILNNS